MMTSPAAHTSMEFFLQICSVRNSPRWKINVFVCFFKPVEELRFKEAETCLGSQRLAGAGRASFQGSSCLPFTVPTSTASLSSV